MNDRETLEKAAELLDDYVYVTAYPGRRAEAMNLRACLRAIVQRAPRKGELYTDNSAVIANAEARIAELEMALYIAQWAIREPAGPWKSDCERRALDHIRKVQPYAEEGD